MKPDTIILHHSATEDGPSVSWGLIRRYHTSWRCLGRIVTAEEVQALNLRFLPVEAPWDDIGYHFGIELAGAAHEILAGRMPDVQGAHCIEHGMNRRSIGICFVGNFDLTPVPESMWQAGVTLVRYLMRALGIDAARVYGHREFALHKNCPGRLFDLDQFRRDLRQ